ncbi:MULTISPECIES: thioredoxin [Flavobacterium]|uniref:thioredoxin n=1 Tax=Flavobacterium TaxID=237 RepID=UPI00391B2759
MNSSFDQLIHSDKPVLIDFYATWCGPCQMLGPILKEVKDRLGERVSIIKVDVDKNQELAAMQQVRSVPTMLLYQNGKLLWRQSGVVSKEDIIKTILDKSI